MRRIRILNCKREDCFQCPYPDCINDYVKKEYPRSKEYRAHQIEWYRQRSKRWESEGLCSVCGARPPRPGFKSCLECALKRRRYANKSHWKYGTVPKVLMDGISLCKKCGKAPPADGYKVCERCLDGCRRALENVPSHKGIALESSGFVRALRADYLLNKKERK